MNTTELPPQFNGATPLKLDAPKTYHLPNWDSLNDPQKLAMLRNIVLQYGRDPRVAMLAVKILKDNNVKPREYQKQAAVLLKWVQDNIYYVNEPLERLQSPLFTLKSGLGDCDDLAILLCSFFECIRLPWKFVLSASTPQGIVRYHENDQNYRKLPYSHIYCAVGNKPFTPTSWTYCEPTLKVPLGWDVTQGTNKLPELGRVSGGMAAGAVAGSLADKIAQQGLGKFTLNIGLAVLVGSITAAGTEIMMDYLRASDLYQSLVLRKRKKS